MELFPHSHTLITGFAKMPYRRSWKEGRNENRASPVGAIATSLSELNPDSSVVQNVELQNLIEAG
jgi:hypothetical protein